MTALVQARKQQKLITGEELLVRDDIGPWELVEGVIEEMAPTSDLHGAIEKNVGFELETFVRRHKTGHVRVGEVGIYIRRNPDTIRAADAVFISEERYAQQETAGYLQIAPDLVVEVLSPSDTWGRVNKKLQEYFTIGVKMVWIVDSAEPQVYVYRSITDIRYFTEADILPGDEILPGLELPVVALYAR